MINYPKNAEKKLNFTKPVYIKVNVSLDFSNSNSGASVRDMFERGHQELKDSFPDFMSIIKYTSIETKFKNSGDSTPSKINYSVEMTVKGKLQYAMSKQCMYMITQKTTKRLGIKTNIEVEKVENITLSNLIKKKVMNLFDFE